MAASLVVDSSVAIKWLVTEPLSAQAATILSAYQEEEALSLHAPDLIYAELGNIVWKKRVFQGFAAADAQRIIAAVRALPLVITPAAELLESAFALAITYRRTVYDALYLALAARDNCRFVTADERLFNAVNALLPQVVWLADWSPAPPWAAATARVNHPSAVPLTQARARSPARRKPP